MPTVRQKPRPNKGQRSDAPGGSVHKIRRRGKNQQWFRLAKFIIFSYPISSLLRVILVKINSEKIIWKNIVAYKVCRIPLLHLAQPLSAIRRRGGKTLGFVSGSFIAVFIAPTLPFPFFKLGCRRYSPSLFSSSFFRGNKCLSSLSHTETESVTIFLNDLA